MSRLYRRLMAGCLLLLVLASAAGNTGSLRQPTAAHTAIGMLSSLTGDVQVKPATAQRWQPARLMMLLYPGDLLSVGAKSQAMTVFFVDGHREKLHPRTKASVQTGTCGILHGAKQTLASPGGIRTGTLLKTAQQQLNSRGGGILMRGDPKHETLIPLTLADTKVLTDRPLFRWTPIRQADQYVVALFDSRHQPLWQYAVPQCELAYPAEEASLQAGVAYYWEVRAFRGETMLTMAFAFFELLDQPTRDTVIAEAHGYQTMQTQDPADLTAWLLLAALYESHDLRDDAILVYRQLVRMRPHEAAFQHALARLDAVKKP